MAKLPDENDLHLRGELPDDPFEGLIRLLPPPEPTPTPSSEDEPPIYQCTPDGRPYLVVPPGDRGWFVATSDGGYRLARESLVRVELMRHWPELDVNLPPPEGEEDKPGKPMTPAQLFACYGADCDAVYYSYTRKTEFRPRPPHTGDLFVRVLTAPEPPAVKHEDVLEFLGVLCGKRVNILLDWLATAPLLELPTGVPVLKGGDSLGKSMIPLGLSRYFGEAVTDYDDVFKERFNDALLRSPLVWLDETTHTDSKSGRFRKLTGNDRHAIEGKGTPSGTLIGCPRLIVTTNDDDPLGISREELTTAGEDAIGVRIILIDCLPEAKEWLKKRGGRRGTGDWVSKPDGSPGKIPELIAWLRQNHPVTHGSRFLVHGDADEWAARIGTRKGTPATILDAYAAYTAMTPAERRELPAEPFKFDDKAYPAHVIIGNKALRDCWKALLGENAPSHRKVAEALTKLAPAGNEKLTLSTPENSPTKDRMNGYLVPRTLLPKEDGRG